MCFTLATPWANREFHWRRDRECDRRNRCAQQPALASEPRTDERPYDFNRDKLVNATDQIIARNNRTSPFTALKG